MPPTHHPSAQALANLLIGDCSPGEALLIERHLAACLQCSGRLQQMGAVVAAAEEPEYGEVSLLHPGVELRPVKGASGLGEAVFHMRVDAGAAVPLDRPPAAEILVLAGGFTADGHPYGPGDFLSFDGRSRPSAISDAIRGCVMLMTTQDLG